MDNLYPLPAHELSVAANATAFTISGILLEAAQVRPGHRLCVSGASAPIKAVDDLGTHTLGIPWQGGTITDSTLWWIERPANPDLVYMADQAARIQALFAKASALGLPYRIKAEVLVADLPVDPEEGDTYLLLDGPNAKSLAVWVNGGWIYVAPTIGAMAVNLVSIVMKAFDGSVWGAVSSSDITDPELLALAGLASAADKGIHFTGSGTAATHDLTPAGRALLADADAAAQRARLGAVAKAGDEMSGTLKILGDNSTRLLMGYGTPVVMNYVGTLPRVQVHGTDTDTTTIAQYRWQDTLTSVQHYLNKSRGTSPGARGILVDGDGIGSLITAGDDGVNFIDATSVQAVVDGTPGVDSMPGALNFRTNPGGTATTIRMTIKANGNLLVAHSGSVNIGSTSAQSVRLQIHGIDAGTAQAGVYRWANGVGGATFSVIKSRGASPGTRGLVQDGDTIGSFQFWGDDGTHFPPAAIVQVQVDGTASAGVMPGRIVLSTAPVGGGGAIERLRVTSTGDTRPGSDNTYSLGDASHRWSAVWAANGTIQTSDERDKVAVGGLGFAGDMVDAVEPLLFRWSVGSNAVEPAESGDDVVADFRLEPQAGVRIHAGFRAQDVRAAMVGAGIDFAAWGLADRNDPDSRQWLRPDQLVAVLWAALKDTRAEVASLRSRLDATVTS